LQSCQVGNCVGSSSAGTGGAGGVTSSGGAGGVIANGGVPNGGAGGVPNGGTGGVPNGGAGGVLGTGGAGPTCNRADLWIALDQSGSTANGFDVGSRWEVIRGGVQGFATTTTRAAAGIVVFPKAGAGVPASCCVDADCGAFGPCTFLVPGFFCPSLPGTCSGASGCQPSSYDAVDVPLTPLPDTSNVFAIFLASVSPAGGSPLAPALERMRIRAMASATANPSNRTAMVLVTDGAPGGCSPGNTIPDVANVAAAALAGSPSIKTYVVTVGVDPSTMAPVATAGGTAIFGTPTTATLAEATNYVRDSLLQVSVDACK